MVVITPVGGDDTGGIASGVRAVIGLFAGILDLTMTPQRCETPDLDAQKPWF